MAVTVLNANYAKLRMSLRQKHFLVAFSSDLSNKTQQFYGRQRRFIKYEIQAMPFELRKTVNDFIYTHGYNTSNSSINRDLIHDLSLRSLSVLALLTGKVKSMLNALIKEK